MTAYYSGVIPASSARASTILSLRTQSLRGQDLVYKLISLKVDKFKNLQT